MSFVSVMDGRWVRVVRVGTRVENQLSAGQASLATNQTGGAGNKVGEAPSKTYKQGCLAAATVEDGQGLSAQDKSGHVGSQVSSSVSLVGNKRSAGAHLPCISAACFTARGCAACRSAPHHCQCAPMRALRTAPPAFSSALELRWLGPRGILEGLLLALR